MSKPFKKLLDRMSPESQRRAEMLAMEISTKMEHPECPKCGQTMIGPNHIPLYTLKYECQCGYVEFLPTKDANKKGETI